ncbi:MAG: ADP-ribosyltransferase domain-containing protein [Bacteroidota bacterium]
MTVWEQVLIYKYSLDGFESLNAALREGKPHPMERLLNEALDKLENYQENIFRGVVLTKGQKQFFKELHEMQGTFVEPAFVSSSKSKRVATMYAKTDTLLNIQSERGKEIERFSFYGVGNPMNEKEVLMKSKTVFEVVGVEQGLWTTEIFLREMV